MTIYRATHDKDNPYVVINKSIVNDERLSLKAKGLWLYAFSRPDDWQFCMQDLINKSRDSRDSVRSGLKELEACGYLYRYNGRENGKFINGEWYFFETSRSPDEIEGMFPKTGFPYAVKPPAGDHPLLSKEELSKERTTTHNACAPREAAPMTEEFVVVVQSFRSFLKEHHGDRQEPDDLEDPHKINEILDRWVVTSQQLVDMIDWMKTNDFWPNRIYGWRHLLEFWPRLLKTRQEHSDRKNASQPKDEKQQLSSINEDYVNKLIEENPQLRDHLKVNHLTNKLEFPNHKSDEFIYMAEVHKDFKNALALVLGRMKLA